MGAAEGWKGLGGQLSRGRGSAGMCSCPSGWGMTSPQMDPLGEAGRGRVTLSPAPATHKTLGTLGVLAEGG